MQSVEFIRFIRDQQMFIKIFIILIICALLEANELDYNNNTNENYYNNSNIYYNNNSSSGYNRTEIKSNFIEPTNDTLNLEPNTNPQQNFRRNKSIFTPPPRQATNCGYKHNGKLLKC